MSGAVVEILRDELGVAHLRARASAQDRLWQMDLDRRRAAGRWPEVVGEVVVGRDAFLRRTGLARSARREQLLASTELRLHPMRYDWRGIEAAARSRVALEPEGAT